MKYQIRYYLNGDKTRFYETEIEFDLSQSSLGWAVREFESRFTNLTIQKIVKL